MKIRKRTLKKSTGANKPALYKAALNKNENMLLNILGYILYISFAFDARIVSSLFTFIIAIGIRFTALYFYEDSPFQHSLESFLSKGISSETYTGMSVWLLFKFFCMSVPYALLMLYYLLTTCLIFIAGIYSGCGTRNIGNEEEYSEFKKFAGYLENKARFQSYHQFLEFLRGKERD